MFFAEKNTLFLKTTDSSHTAVLENDSEYERVASILETCKIAAAKSEIEMMVGIQNAITAIPTADRDFDDRGVFSPNYLRSRLFDDVHVDIKSLIQQVKPNLNKSTQDILKSLGWNLGKEDSGVYQNKEVSIIVTNDDFNIRKKGQGVAPSYSAVSELKNSPWVILTNGHTWRLYTNKVSASTTNYFEIIIRSDRESALRYLVSIFSASSYGVSGGKSNIELFYEQAKKYAQKLEEDLSSRIMSPNGLFLDIVKGVLDHDMKKKFSADALDNAYQISLKIMYRIWFILYAESRDLLPTRDKKYHPISLESLRSRLDAYDKNPEGGECWVRLLQLFSGIRKGSPKHNLPQYNGDLFKSMSSIDKSTIKNKYIVRALHGLLEKDGEPVDYASLSVRHLGNIYETLMEFSVRQADKNMMLVEDRGNVREVKTKSESTYTYKINDLYLASKGGIFLRKSSASYYTPEDIVKFLVDKGLQPIFNKREKMISEDISSYVKNPSQENRHKCLDRLLDIQVLDPSMGSGHFLVEALNKITAWATGILKIHPDHPLLKEIDDDRDIVIAEQKKNGIVIGKGLLKDDVLLKRKVMKRCIFGVDLNPLAVELARLSLWLDSFAIGVPLTYMNHHIKVGDSTIGVWREDLKDKQNHSLDHWIDDTDRVGDVISQVSQNSDVTVKQVHSSEAAHEEYEKLMIPHKAMLDVLTASKIDKQIITKKTKDVSAYVEKFGLVANGTIKPDSETVKMRTKVQELSKAYRFFHWELEMMDAFTDARRGFDLIVGNPPWDKMKPSDNEFFTVYDPTFRSLKTKTEKKKKMSILLKDKIIRNSYDNYKQIFKNKSLFYNTFNLQGSGDKDLWQIVLERTLNLVTDDGIISMIIPSQLLSNTGGIDMRKYILDKEILSLYVFENRKKIFPIHSSYRFALLTIHNHVGSDTFPAGFYLHNLSSLYDNSVESEKFTIFDKKDIKIVSPDDYSIPEVSKEQLELLIKISKNSITLNSGMYDGWEIAKSRGFDRSLDSDLLKKDGDGWPILEGRNIHQFNSLYSTPEFIADENDGFQCESKKKIFSNDYKLFFNSFRLVFRNISSPTNMRTVLSSIIEPQSFYTDSLRALVLTYNGNILINKEYYQKISYLVGIFNSLIFDFCTRSKAQLNISPIISTIPFPNTKNYNSNIEKLSAILTIRGKNFEEFAKSMDVKNIELDVNDRIHTTAKLDAYVAHAYNLSKNEYKIILNSFKFDEDSNLHNQKNIDWSDNKTLRKFYGEVRKLAPIYYDQIAKETAKQSPKLRSKK